MKYFFLCILFFSTLVKGYTQPFSAYTNIRNEFFIFDNGSINKIEPLNPVSYKIGRKGIAYLDNQSILKFYKDGMVNTINDMVTTSFDISDNLMMYRSGNRLAIIDGNNAVLLSKLCENFKMGDSVILFYDLNKRSFNGYYNGEIVELESFLNLGANDLKFDSTVKVSDNIGAYINYNDQFKVFFNKQSEVLENQAVKEFQVGRNTVGYIDINNIFKVYYKGQSFVIDPFAPKSFMVGDDLVAYQSNDGYFKIFYKGNLFTIGYYEPKYQVSDRLVAFEDLNGYFKIFHEGIQTQIDNYYPEKILIGYNSMAYVNKNNFLRLFSNGKMYDISSMSINDYRLDYDVLQYKVGFNSYKIFFNGEFYN